MPTPQPSKPSSLNYAIKGMDCANCATKISSLVDKTPGVKNASTSFINESLKLELDESQTPKDKLESLIRSLGYEPVLKAQDGVLTNDADERAWFVSAQGRLVLVSGALLLAAIVVWFVRPDFARWGFTLATLLGVAPLLRKAVVSARAGQPFGINTLVSSAAVGALMIGEAPEAALVVFLFAVGELLEGVAAGRARSGIKALSNLTPKTALRVDAQGTREVLATELRVGDYVLIQPGGRVPADGTIIKGSSLLNDAPITGESTPVFKQAGDSVYAGSINVDAALTILVERDASDNTVARIIKLVEEAQDKKAPTERFIDRFSRYYTPVVMLTAVLVAVIPPLLFAGAWSVWVYKALALLLIGCPCALVLSVPAAITSAIASGAKHGLLIKGGAILELLASVTTVAFDKTGTLTEGKPKVTDVIALNTDEATLLQIAVTVEANASHPLAQAIQSHAQHQTPPLPVLTHDQATTLPGKAATARIQGKLAAVGSPRYAAEQNALSTTHQTRIQTLESEGKTVVVVLLAGEVLGLIALRDEARADSADTVRALQRAGKRTLMLTGDNVLSANVIAAELGLEAHAALLPEDKLRLISNLRSSGVMMVGDGINDAPALAEATVSVSMGAGTDVALETADVALLRSSVAGVTDLFALSQATMRNVKQNIAFALGLKLLFLITTLLGLTGLWLAILSDTGATAIVTANALRLLKFKSLTST